MEDLGLTTFGDAYRGRRVLVTGHTGFKGSWLALWLAELGADLFGVALPPDTAPSHHALLALPHPARMLDLRDTDAAGDAIRAFAPEIVFHLAAQALVRRSYDDPLGTFATNAMGTANVLEACRRVPELRAVVVVTTDKCYENTGEAHAFRETDPLGGYDPYSASKAAAELVAASWRRSFFSAPGAALVATARAGNVIGGGDWAADRLVPDLVRATAAGTPLEIRYPDATRPWQHVLECLSGYLALGARLLRGERDCATAFNFGPDAADNRSVADVLRALGRHWPGLAWTVSAAPAPHEAQRLALDSAKARARLGWRPVWSLDDAVAATAQWYRDYAEGGVVRSREQLARYVAAARGAGLAWAA